MSTDPLNLTLLPAATMPDRASGERAGVGDLLDAPRVRALLARDDSWSPPHPRRGSGVSAGLSPGVSASRGLPRLVAAELADVETALGLEPMAQLRAGVLRDGERFEALLAGYRLGTALRQAGETSINLVLGPLVLEPLVLEPRLDAATDEVEATWIEGVGSAGVLVCPRVTPGWVRSVVEGTPSWVWAHGLEMVQLVADPAAGAAPSVDAELVDALRQDLSFEGVVVAPTVDRTADLPGAVDALRAGCDLLVVTIDQLPDRTAERALVEVLAEALDGLPAERVDEAVARIDALREDWLG